MLRVVIAEEPEVWFVAPTSTCTSDPTTTLLHLSSLAPNELHDTQTYRQAGQGITRVWPRLHICICPAFL
ncbi:hypothetical protein E2C01_018538 [Portunus trituberculatus]|uniref:Uncharacterized protein n=1 Tax=Portunus trituberculatus TaxID=210409 RepID=A0A5B7DWF2_PORTR|nr:hypothetical protein [Portunus trituberculatus]